MDLSFKMDFLATEKEVLKDYFGKQFFAESVAKQTCFSLLSLQSKIGRASAGIFCLVVEKLRETAETINLNTYPLGRKPVKSKQTLQEKAPKRSKHGGVDVAFGKGKEESFKNFSPSPLLFCCDLNLSIPQWLSPPPPPLGSTLAFSFYD